MICKVSCSISIVFFVATIYLQMNMPIKSFCFFPMCSFVQNSASGNNAQQDNYVLFTNQT